MALRSGAGSTPRGMSAVAAAALAALALSACTSSAPIAGPSGAPSTAGVVGSEPTSNSPTPSATTPTQAERTDSPIEVKETVPIDEVGDFGDGIRVGVARVRAVEAGGGGGIGDLAGPAIAVTIDLTNDGSTPVTLDEVVVTATYGKDGIPAPGVFNDTRANHFAGSLAAGASARGTYVFSLPEDQRRRVTILVSHSGGVPNVAFQGAVG